MRRIGSGPLAAVAAIALAAGVCGVAAAPAAPAGAGSTRQFIVLYARAASDDAARAAIEQAGGTIVRENRAVGVATVAAASDEFRAAAAGQPALAGVAVDRSIGFAPAAGAPERDDLAKVAVDPQARGAAKPAKPKPEPLSGLQWNLAQIGATETGSFAIERGQRKVLVGVMDSGVDASHPDLAPNFNRELSRNFTRDIPVDANGRVIDGPCDAEPDRSCDDPADVDERGHGTHVAGIIGAALNGLGVAGVAPRVSLVNLRAGQDSGFFFLQPTVDALTYAGDVGVDVVNMSYFLDPWLFNCPSNPADSPDDQAEQRVIVEATQRAIDYAHARGVVIVAAAGNQATDYSKPSVDRSSPTFADAPGEAPRTRDIDPASCLRAPNQLRHVINVTSTGISERKAFYSNYGLGYPDLAAPGGDLFDTADNRQDFAKGVLTTWPRSLVTAGEIDAAGNPVVPYLVRDCRGVTCAYYRWFQGTSSASPHVAGVAALIVSRYGRPVRKADGAQGMMLDPAITESILFDRARRHPCPDPPAYTYTRVLANGQIVTTTHTCEGPGDNNGFYGHGIVDAAAAVAGASLTAPPAGPAAAAAGATATPSATPTATPTSTATGTATPTATPTPTASAGGASANTDLSGRQAPSTPPATASARPAPTPESGKP
jgi:subtilisin family serine protease